MARSPSRALLAPWTERDGKLSLFKTIVLLLALAPAIYLCVETMGQGARSLRFALIHTGFWSIRLLLLSIAITALSRIAHWPRLITVRRMLGLMAFAYALVHVGLYAVDQGWHLAAIAAQIAGYLYLAVGFAAILIMMALASTSYDAAAHFLGGRRWRALHRWSYNALAFAIAHYLLAARLRASEALVLAGLLLWLLLYRYWAHREHAHTGARALLLVTLAAALATMLGELAWYGLATGIDPGLIFEANFHLLIGLRPTWWVLAIGLALSALAATRKSHAHATRSA